MSNLLNYIYMMPIPFSQILLRGTPLHFVASLHLLYLHFLPLFIISAHVGTCGMMPCFIFVAALNNEKSMDTRKCLT